jgi:hypothetical protein
MLLLIVLALWLVVVVGGEEVESAAKLECLK